MLNLTYKYRLRPPTHEVSGIWKQLYAGHKYQNTLVEVEHQRRAILASGVPEGEAKVWYANAAKNAYHSFNELSWGTKLVRADAARTAARKAGKRTAEGWEKQPRFNRWNGEGQIAVECIGGMAVARLETDTRIRVTGDGKHRELWLRIGSDEHKDPIWGRWSLIWHRDLPENARIKWVKINTTRVGTHMQWYVCFSIEIPDVSAVALPTPTKGTIAIDVGWRRKDQGLRVCYWHDDAGNNGELLMPARLVERWQKTEDLQSIRDKNANELIDALKDAHPEGIDTTHIHMWKARKGKGASCNRLASMVLAARNTGRADEIMDTMEAWRKQDKHLYDWQSYQRSNVLRARREIYRKFALFCAQYRRVVIEHLRLTKFADLQYKETDEPHAITNARTMRFKASLSELLSTIGWAVHRAGGEWIEVRPEYTTQTCAKCGHVAPVGEELVHECQKCKATWDQDDNAAINILRAADCPVACVESTRMKGLKKTGESKVQQLRKKGKKRALETETVTA